MPTATLPAYIIYTTTFRPFTQEVICSSPHHTANYIHNNIYFIVIKSAFSLHSYFCWLSLIPSNKDLQDTIDTINNNCNIKTRSIINTIERVSNGFPEASLYNLSFYKIFPSCIQLKYQRSICISPPHCILKYKPDFMMEVCNNIEILTYSKPLLTLHWRNAIFYFVRYFFNIITIQSFFPFQSWSCINLWAHMLKI